VADSSSSRHLSQQLYLTYVLDNSYNEISKHLCEYFMVQRVDTPLPLISDAKK
jgi:hypothetical protein